MDQVDLYLTDHMGERTISSVLALSRIVAEGVTELCLVLVCVVESLHVAVRQRTFVTFEALVGLSKPAKICWVIHMASSLVFQGVVVLAVLRIMLAFNSTLLCLKTREVQVQGFATSFSIFYCLLKLHLIMPRIIWQRIFEVWIVIKVFKLIHPSEVATILFVSLARGISLQWWIRYITYNSKNAWVGQSASPVFIPSFQGFGLISHWKSEKKICAIG